MPFVAMGLRTEVITKISLFQNTLWALELYLELLFYASRWCIPLLT